MSTFLSHRATVAIVLRHVARTILLLVSIPSIALASQDDPGSIRGLVMDGDFDVPLRDAEVLILETNEAQATDAQGRYRFDAIPAGTYTLVFSKEGFSRLLRQAVVVQPGNLVTQDATLAGDFTELEPFVVQGILALGGGSEEALIDLRFDSAAFLDSIGKDFMSKGGFSDAASALRAVSGASVQDGKFAVIRGLPDRYVSSQLNGVRLPSADEDKRAVELDQFPSAVIESLQISKTFTPDQQGDASGGAVNIQLRGIPEETITEFTMQSSFNSQVAGRNDFLSYTGGGLTQFGSNDGRHIQTDNLGSNWTGAVGVTREDAPTDFKWNASAGTSTVLDSGIKVGGFLNVFYERDSSFEQGFDDSYWVDTPGAGLVPETSGGSPTGGDFKTNLFDVEKSSQSVQWGGIATFGMEVDDSIYNLTYLHSHTAEDTATLAEDTRGKAYFFPGYDVNDPAGPGNISDDVDAAPYLRTETLEYTERTTGSLQLSGKHEFDAEGLEIGDLIFRRPKLDWNIARSFANLDQPDKRQFGSVWVPESFNPGAPPFVPPFFTPPTHDGLFPAATFSLGNLQRIFKKIEEEGTQLSVNATFPFEQWDGEEGFLKAGYFSDRVDRRFDQETFSNSGDQSSYQGAWEDYWSAVFPDEPGHAIFGSTEDIDYDGTQDITAFYLMGDIPVGERWNLITGARLESTDLGIVNDPEANALYFPPGATAPVALNPGSADVSLSEQDLLPSLGVIFEATDDWTFRASVSKTIARQTFKEITPIIQQEFLGGPVFVGNPGLRMSALTNFDLRADYRPTESSLVSFSAFHKDLKDPIEYVQRVGLFSFTTPTNYPKGELSGLEFEARQDLGHWNDSFRGLSVGANATFIKSKVQVPEDEAAFFASPTIQAPLTSRRMTNAPERLLNLFATYEVPSTGTAIGVFYTIQGETLIAGAGVSNNNFVPSLFAQEYDTLNLTVSQELGSLWKLRFQAKNLTNPTIETAYSSPYTGPDVTNTAFSRGIEYSISIGLKLSF